MARPATGRLNLPRVNLVPGSGSLVVLRWMKHPMHTIYEIINVPEPSDTRLLKAAVLPMLISDRSAEIAVEMMTELTGTSSLGWTYRNLLLVSA